jgi:hypothetical protein
MKPGDRVRLLKGTEEGIIVRFIDDKQLEVEIDDGFVIPALIREVVPISPEEDYRFHDKPLVKPKESTRTIEFDTDTKTERIILAIELKDDGSGEVYIVNVTSMNILFTIGKISNKQAVGLFSGACDAKSYNPIGRLSKESFEDIEKIYFQVLNHLSVPGRKMPPFEVTKKWKWSDMSDKVEMTPFLNRKAIQIILEEDKPEIDPAVLKERMMEPTPTVQETRRDDTHRQREKVVDLHIENLLESSSTLSSGQILEQQLQTFDKEMDNALLDGLKSIKFIHGIGNGILRDKIHKKLSQNESIKYYEDADKERFGYGATLIHFK